MFLYNILSTIAVILYSPWILFKKGPADKSAFIRERFGLSEYKRTDIWVHAVSVGEIIASLPFLKVLKNEFPDRKITVSTTTYTGQRVARERFLEAEQIMYMPVDSVLCTDRVVSGLQPKIFITIETELWPSLINSLKKAGSRIIILNGRISRESFSGYKKIRFFMKDVLSKIDFLYMQSKADADRIIYLGAERERVGVMGNIKFDISMKNEHCPEWLGIMNGDILLAASTHNGEEEIILDAFLRLKDSHKDLKLIIAPRHPERFDEVGGLLEKTGLTYVRRSAVTNQQSVVSSQEIDILLLDTIGELSRVFSACTIAFIGGSLVPVGGHNILEPAYWARPIIFGPYMDNFPMAAEFLESEAAIEVRNSNELVSTVNELIEDRDKSSQMGTRAKKIVDQNKGAVQKAIDLVRGYIGDI